MNLEKPTGLVKNKKKSPPAQRQLTFYELSQQRKKQREMAKLKKKYGDDYEHDLVVYSKSKKYKKNDSKKNEDKIVVNYVNANMDDDTLLDGLSASIIEDDIISPIQSKFKHKHIFFMKIITNNFNLIIYF